MQKYLAQVEAVAPNHLEKTQSLVRAFLAGSGPKLQQRLIERQQKLANWATDWWLNDMYLTVPLGLPINSNPGLAAKPRQISSQQDAAIFLARYINELLDYQEILDRRELETEKVKSKDGKMMQPLCMEQHYQMFRLYRRPGIKNDEHVHLDRNNSGNHIIVAHHNTFYSVAVRAPDRDRITIEELAQQFLKIMEKPADAKTLPVGILTTAKRPVWGKAREELMKNERNCHNIELIETCLCIVCIDDDALPTTFNNSINETDKWLNNRDYANVLHHMLHGGGSQYFGANRWFDKTVQLILGKDGLWGLSYEHSGGEAPAIFSVFERLTDQVDEMPALEHNMIPSHLPDPEKLEWSLSEQSRNDIHEAMIAIDALVEDLDICILWFTEYSKEFIKSCNISPDAYIQLALQLTYFRLHKRLVATYESAGIRRFRKGRVDVIRGASPEALSWVKAMCQDDPEVHSSSLGNSQDEGIKRVQFTLYSKQRIKELFDLAVQRQTKEMTDNIMGHGIDNHLMGLRYAAVEAGEPVPDIFNDEAYKITQHFSLSTSQITTKNDMIGGYGPVVPDGYGCGYNVRKNGFIFSCSAFHSDDKTSALKFAKTLNQSLIDMASMLKYSKQIAQ
ncbi:hypothetical protein TKK_0001725 [Trichogramma kaykai]